MILCVDPDTGDRADTQAALSEAHDDVRGCESLSSVVMYSGIGPSNVSVSS